MNRKRLILIGALIAVVLVGAGLFFAFKGKLIPGLSSASPSPSAAAKRKKITDPTNVIDVAERPYMRITPRGDGRQITLSVMEVKKAATAVDYELEYQTGSMMQGAFGNLTLDKLPISKDILLGSCSAGGACTYHENVQGGNVLLKFASDASYALKSEWKFTQKTAKETELGSRDGKFQLSGKPLSAVKFAVIYNSPGFPGKLSGSLVSDVYSVGLSQAVTGKVQAVIRMSSESAGAKIAGWNGKEWQTFTTKVDGKTATAEVDPLEAYVVVGK